MARVAIIHFAPLELYPPAQNLIALLKEKNSCRCAVYTTSPVSANHTSFLVESTQVELWRIGRSGASLSKIKRYLNYVAFYLGCLFLLVYHRPRRILYFETISSWPVYVYKRFFNSTCEVLIHYHEYTSPFEYQSGMKLSFYFHQLEKWLYPRTTWVSHTNELRLNAFKQDIVSVLLPNPKIVPNYPPRKWKTEPVRRLKPPVKVAYIGALSLTTMYTREFAEWVLDHHGAVTWDIYSNNYSDEANTYLRGLNSDWVHLHEGVNYEELPFILKAYDVGVVLYNGHIANYVMNAPNKLFEYLVCGLDVWFPNVMTGSIEFVNESGSPKVLALNFNDLKSFDIRRAMARDGSRNSFSFCCEDALKPLIEKLCIL